MTILLRGACALLVGAVCGAASLAQSTDQNAVKALFEGTEASALVQQTCANADCGTCDAGCYSGCDTGCDLGGCGIGGGALSRGQFFFGAEYLSVRANFSEATAYRELDVINNQEIFHQIDMNYGDSYRLYGGYRLCDCGGEIRFTYTNFSSDGGGITEPNPNLATDGRVFTAPYELALGDNDVLVTGARVDVDNFDIGFSKTIPLGCPLSCGGCGDCGDCCDPCGCGPVCPAWDITWTGGIRIANVDSTLNWATDRDPANTTPDRTAESTVNFDGVGLRFGLLGRRYLGRQGLLSAYVRGDISLLLGEVEHSVSGTALTDPSITSTQVVPVTEIEAGLTGYLTQNISVSGGYMLSAWHDLGHRTEYDYSVTGTQTQLMDDANLMTFDGFFLRAEAAF